VFTGASSVAVTRYRYRGSSIPTPLDPETGTTTNG
jgi:RNA-directed DNA polymerase